MTPKKTAPTTAEVKTGSFYTGNGFWANRSGAFFNVTSFVRNAIFFLFILISCSRQDSPPPLPQLTTANITAISDMTATSGGEVISGGVSVTTRGVCWSINPSPTINDSKTSDGSGGGAFISTLTGLIPGTSYFVRAYATNASGTGYGLSFSFTTKVFNLPVLTTKPVTNISMTQAVSGGDVTSDGGAVVTARGVCYSLSHNPTIANGKTIDGTNVGSFTSNISGLAGNSTYYVRSYATNSVGTAYGNEVALTTLVPLFTPGSGVTDLDGNTYSSVVVGTQEWTAMNLKTTKYSNGDPVVNATDAAWISTTSGAWCYYNNDNAFNNPYGKLYNWYAVSDPRNVCPSGWHVPSSTEWLTLQTFLGGSGVAGGKLKEEGTIHWITPNTGATNTSGITTLPGGNRRGGGNPVFEVLGTLGRYYSSTDVDGSQAYSYDIANGSVNVGEQTFLYNYGFSVRCIKN